MNDRNPLTIPATEDIDRLWGKSDLGHKHNNALAERKGLINSFHYNLGFSAAGYAEKKGGTSLIGHKLAFNRIVRLLLCIA